MRINSVTIYRENVLVYIEWTGTDFIVHVIWPDEENADPQLSEGARVVRLIPLSLSSLYDIWHTERGDAVYSSQQEFERALCGNEDFRASIMVMVGVVWKALLNPDVIRTLASAIQVDGE